MEANEKKTLWGKPVKLVVALIFLILLLILFVWLCKSHKEGKLVINKPVKAPVAISFVDANRLLSIQIPVVKLSLIDDAGQVVTPNNLSFSSLEIKGGVVSLALKDSAVFNKDSPYHFAIKVEAPGYSTTFLSIIIREDKAQYIPVFMTKIEDPPAGMSGFTGNIAIANSRIDSSIILVPKTSNNQKRMVSVSFEEGTVLLSKGEPLRGGLNKVDYNFSYASPRTLAALRTFPGSGLITNATDSIGNVLATPRNPFLFVSAGWMTLEMKSGSENVTGFSKPVVLRMPISDSSTNPISSKPYKQGDKIDIWSLDDRCVWKKEGVAVVKNSDDGLVALLSIRHLSSWNLDFKTNVCASTMIPYNNTVTTMGPFSAYCEIVSILDGLPLHGTFGTHNIDFDPGTHDYEVINGRNGDNAVFLVYDNTSGPGGVLTSSNFTFCPMPPATPPTLNIASTTVKSMEMEFVIRDGTNGLPICNNAVFFSPGATCPTGVAYLYGGNLTVTHNASTHECVGKTTLYQIDDFDAACVRLFYGNLVASGTVAQTVDIIVDFMNTSTTAISIPTTIDGVSQTTSATQATQQLLATGGYRIVIPGGTSGGVTSISPCTGCTP